jgi:hypothetical protein
MLRFLERIFGSGKKEAKGRVLTLEELRKWCVGSIAGYEKDAIGELETKVDKILSYKEEAVDIIEELEEYKFPEDIKRRIYKPALTHRPTYIRGMREAFSGLTRPESSMAGFRRFHKGLTGTLMAVQKIQLSQGRFLAIVFREQLLSLGGVLNKIIDLKGECEDVLRKFEENTRDVQRLFEEIEVIEASMKNLKILIGEIGAIEDTLKDLDKRSIALNRELENLVNSPSYKRFKKEKESLERLQRKRQDVENQILNLLRPKARVFRKFKRYLERRGQRDEYIDGYLDDPVRTFTREEPGYPRLRRILRGIEQAAQEGDLSLSKKEERSTSVDWRTLGRLWEEAMQLEAASKRLDETPEKEKAELDLKIRKMEDEKNRLSQSLVDKKREIKKLKRSIARCKTELETELSDLRKGDFSIEMPSIPHTRG